MSDSLCATTRLQLAAHMICMRQVAVGLSPCQGRGTPWPLALAGWVFLSPPCRGQLFLRSAAHMLYMTSPYRLDVTISSDRTFILEASPPHRSFPRLVRNELNRLQRQGLLVNAFPEIHSTSRALIHTAAFAAINSPGVPALRNAVAAHLAQRWRVPTEQVGYSTVRIEF